MQSATNVPYPAYIISSKSNSNTANYHNHGHEENQNLLSLPMFLDTQMMTSPHRKPQAYNQSSEHDLPENHLYHDALDTGPASSEIASLAYHSSKPDNNGLQSGDPTFVAYNPYPSPPAGTGSVEHSPTRSPSPTALTPSSRLHYKTHSPSYPHSFSNSLPTAQHHGYFSQPIMTTNIPPPPKEALPQPPLQLDLCFSQSYSANHANQKQQRHQQPPHSAPVVTSFPSPSQHRFHSQPFSPQSYEPASPPASGIVPSLRSMGSQANMSQNIDNTAYCLHASLSSLSLTPSVNSLGHQPELTRIASNGSNSSIKRPASLTSRHTVPVVKAVMDIKTAEVLSSLTFEDMPRCYVVAPPIVASSSGPFTPFRIVAPCQALGVRGQNTIHFPEHQGYTVNNAEEVMKTHGTVLQHFANLASLFAGASDSSFGKSLGKHAERFLKNVKPTTRVPLMKDTKELSTGVDGTSVQIEKFMTEHLHLESIAQLMRDITKSNTASDWAGGLQRIVSPGTGRSMWVCQDCFTGLQLGRYEWNDEQASLDDLIGYPDKTGAKSEAHLLNATAVDVYTQMIRGQSRIRNAVINILPAYFEAPERKATAMFSANQKLIQNLAKVLTEAHLTMVEINANQTRDSELMDKDNIYLHVRRLFSCYQLEYVKLSGLPFLLREKLPGFLDHAKFLSFDGVLVDNDKAVSNMKKLITENSDMEHLALTRAQMTSTGLKVLCSAHKNLRRIARLDLSNNRIDAEGIKELANQVMPTSLDLRFLDLSDNPKIGTVGCLSLLKAIWPASSHATRQKNLVSLQLANTGFCDEAASQLSRNIDGPSGIGALYNINLSGNQITKPGLLALMTCVSQNAHQSPLRKLSLSQHVSALSIPGAMDYEVVHFFGVHPTLTHLTLSKLSLGMVAQIVNLNKCLISLTVDDVVCVSPQDPHFALSCFNSLCQSIASNTVMQDLKIRSPWSFWALAFQSTGAAPNSSEQESNWLDAAGWMAVIENSLQRNTVLRCFQMRGVTNFEEELVLATAMAPPSITSPGSIFGGSLGRYGGSGMLGASEVARTDGESKMMALSQNIRMYLERNQVLYYGRKHGIEEQLINQY